MGVVSDWVGKVESCVKTCGKDPFTTADICDLCAQMYPADWQSLLRIYPIGKGRFFTARRVIAGALTNVEQQGKVKRTKSKCKGYEGFTEAPSGWGNPIIAQREKPRQGKADEVNIENHLKEARRLYQKAIAEFERAKEKNDGTVLRDACGKGWLSAIEAANALLVKKGVKEEELPRADRGRRFMVDKYAERELRLYYYSLREGLHIEGYYDGALSFDEVQMRLDDLNLYIQKVEELG